MRDAPVGFSWTTLFFGALPALVRSDWKWGLLQFIAAACTLGLTWFVFPFIYNRLYLKDLIKKGFKVKDAGAGDLRTEVALTQAQSK